MAPRVLLLLTVSLGAACSQPTTRCPEPSPPVRVPDGATPPEPHSAPTPSASPPRTGPRPTADFPISYNCEAPLAITEEVSRLLAAAAAHGTASAACVDGPGRRIAVNDILVCPAAPDGSDVVVKAFYQVVTYPEGDTRGCGSGGRDCSWLEPSASEHLIEQRLRKGKDPSRATMVDPGPLPGFPEDSTPLSAEHDGNCYGRSPAFVPAAILL